MIASTHRAHGHTLAKGTHPNELMAELYGKVEGCSHGYGGSMHLYDVERGNLGANAVVGGGLPAIVGAALAFKLRGEPRVAVAFFGDGATNIGTFHESLNLAQLWKVPAVFVCENNHYAESTPAKQQLPIEDLTKRAEAFGMTSMTVDGQDVEAVYETAKKALEHARDGQGPGLRPRRDLPALPATTSATRRSTGPRRRCASCARRRIRSRSSARSSSSPTRSGRSSTREATRIVEDSVEFAKNGTDPKPEDALKNVYAYDDGDHDLPRGRARRHERGDAPRRRRLHHGRGHRRDGRLDGRHAGDARRVRPRARPQHADLRDGDRRRRHRRGHGGHAPDRRDHVPGLHDARDGADRQPGRQAPLHVGRPAQGPAHDPDAGRRRLVAGRAARAAARGVVRPRARAQGRLPVDADGRARPALELDLRRQPGRSSSSTAPSTRSRARSRTRSSRSRSARRASTARART